MAAPPQLVTIKRIHLLGRQKKFFIVNYRFVAAMQASKPADRKTINN